MAHYKLNTLHLHLTDDQGWRLHVPSRPQLSRLSSETSVNGDPGGFYTPSDYATSSTTPPHAGSSSSPRSTSRVTSTPRRMPTGT